MALRDYAKFFRDDNEVEEAKAQDVANEVVAWVSCAYHDKFLQWLDKEAGKPIAISSNQLSVVESAVRANTLREVKDYLVRLRSKAAATVGEK